MQLIRAIGTVVVTKRRMHPNQHVMMRMARFVVLMDWPAQEEDAIIRLSELQSVMQNFDGRARFFGYLSHLDRNEMERVAALAICALLVDGRLRRRDKKLYKRIVNVCGCKNMWPEIRRLQLRFLRGQGLEVTDVLQTLRSKKKAVPFTSAEKASAWRRWLLDLLAF